MNETTSSGRFVLQNLERFLMISSVERPVEAAAYNEYAVTLYCWTYNGLDIGWKNNMPNEMFHLTCHPFSPIHLFIHPIKKKP